MNLLFLKLDYYQCNLNLEQSPRYIRLFFQLDFHNFENILITRERHRYNLEQCVEHLENFEEKNNSEEFDKASEDLRLAIRNFGKITGKVDVEEILGTIFRDFCIGK